MKKFFSLILFLIPSLVLANPNCNYIRDSNARNFCKAVSTGSELYCYYITDREQQRVCKSKVLLNNRYIPKKNKEYAG